MTVIVPEMTYEFMFGNVRDYIWRNFDNIGDQLMTPQVAALMLFDFENTHGDDSIIKMYGFLRYAAINKLDSDKVRATIAHDLNGRNCKVTLPKTDDYYEFCNL
jgi:hypothetical protein